MAKPSWISINKSSGSNNDSVSVTATAYEGRVNRTGTLTVNSSTGGLSQTVSITQVGVAKTTVTSSPESFAATGGSSYKITGYSNVKDFYFVCNSPQISNPSITINSGSPLSGWDGNDKPTITGDPGASAKYLYEIHFTVAANNTDTAKPIQIKVGDTVGTAFVAVNITQSAGTKTYAAPVINTFSYPQAGAGASTVNPTVTYSQTWGWNGSTIGGGTITTGGTLSFNIGSNPQLPTPSINTTSGAVTFTTLGTTVTNASEYNVDCTVTLNGKSGSKRATLTRAGNSVTYNNATLSITDPLSVEKSSGTLDISLLITDAFSQTASFTSGASRNCSPDLASTKASLSGLNAGFVTVVENRKLQYTTNDTIVARTQNITVTVNGEGGKVATQTLAFTQRAGDATLSVTPTTLSFEAGGGTSTLTIRSNTSWTIS